jgi:hypothetical protein
MIPIAQTLLVDLVQDEERDSGEFAMNERGSSLHVVVVEIGRVRFVGPPQEAEGQRGLSDLPRAAQKDHLAAREIRFDGQRRVADAWRL